ncbi:hypothetical protein EVAR_49469_1 [Eumeta japonica]|uniref:Uncharacterized protein n=1 Tax=Eumeta variegata TaxID=151549 RepID=A0A4C1Y1Y2_EUMVA|nr:hypothetical protein EVAR_49469_1 [Eumeta japonica]
MEPESFAYDSLSAGFIFPNNITNGIDKQVFVKTNTVRRLALEVGQWSRDDIEQADRPAARPPDARAFCDYAHRNFFTNNTFVIRPSSHSDLVNTTIVLFFVRWRAADFSVRRGAHGVTENK